MVRIRYTLGFARLYGKEFFQNVWTDANAQMVLKVTGALGWEVEGQEPVEEIVETVEEVVDETIDLSTLTKKELQALCDERGLEYKAFDNKSVLISLLSDEEE
jgi:rRNA maturation endonuclease Nob1